MEKIYCNKKEIKVLIIKKDIKHLYLRVKEDHIQINAPKYISQERIKNFICKHFLFIQQKLEEKSYLFGEENALANKELYKELLPKVIEQFLKVYTKKMNLYPSKIGYRFNSSRWGSCSAKNSINFNYYLAKLPKRLIEYVVVHELAHIKHKNHSKEFWKFVEQFLPDLKERKKELREWEKIV